MTAPVGEVTSSGSYNALGKENYVGGLGGRGKKKGKKKSGKKKPMAKGEGSMIHRAMGAGY